jgi:Na+-translocating ferredoxin:NAD+ oxidoreductase RnfG subunit
MTETKKKSEGMVRLTVILFAITAIIALLLGLVNYITEDKIEAINADKTASAMKEYFLRIPIPNSNTQAETPMLQLFTRLETRAMSLK